MAYEYNPPFNAPIYAQARADGARAFRQAVTQRYRDSYEDFWLLRREEVSPENLQAVLDELGPLVLQILTDSATFVGAITAAFPGELDEKYRDAPYEYTVTPQGRLVIGELKEAWRPEEVETPE